MKVGIIEAGEPPPTLLPKFGSYGDMTRRLLSAEHDYETFRAMDGQLPRGGECEAFIITGSACSVYDDLPWIARLTEFLRSVEQSSKFVGICFGHQIMAQAFGGKVEKAPQGWGLGLHRYVVREHAKWMDDVSAVRAIASHRDQIVAVPQSSRTLAASDFTPHAILSYQDRPAMSVQFHPEFDAAYSKALFAARRAPDLTREEVHRAIASLTEPNDNARLGQWINSFLAS